MFTIKVMKRDTTSDCDVYETEQYSVRHCDAVTADGPETVIYLARNDDEPVSAKVVGVESVAYVVNGHGKTVDVIHARRVVEKPQEPRR